MLRVEKTRTRYFTEVRYLRNGREIARERRVLPGTKVESALLRLEAARAKTVGTCRPAVAALTGPERRFAEEMERRIAKAKVERR